ncbi:MAG: MFS transporter [Bdellovibrionota bacterium]
MLFISQAFSQICDKTMSIGLVWTLVSKYSAEILPWFLFIGFLPHLLMFPFAPGWIHRWSPLKTIIGADFFRGLVFLILLVSLFLFSEKYFLISLLLCNFLVGIGSSLFNPAILSLPPLLVSEKNILGLNVLIDLCFSLSSVFAAALAIFLLNHTSIQTLILFNTLSFIFCGFYQMTIKQKPSLQTEYSPTKTDKSILMKHADIKNLLLLFLMVNIVMAPLFLFLPWYAKNIFSGQASDLAWLEISWAIGSVIGGLGLVVFQKKNGPMRISKIWQTILSFGIILVAFALSSQLIVACLWLIALGISLSVLNVNVLTYFQKKLTERELPSVMTAVNLISAASIPISMLISAFIIPKVYVPTMALACGGLVLLLALACAYLFQQNKETQ